MADDLYDVDFVAWTEAQAAALRARRSGANALDYDNLAEEIEDLGKSEQRSCDSFVQRIIEHLLKIEFVGPRETLPHWRVELFNFRTQLGDLLTPVLTRRTCSKLGRLFDRAVHTLLLAEQIATKDAVLGTLTGYDWERIIDPDWYPEPRYD